MKGKTARKPAGLPRPSKKHKPISHYWQAAKEVEQGLEESGSCSPSHADEPTPAGAMASGSRSRPQPAADRQLGSTMLRSLQRRFVQQTLQTPFLGASGSCQGGAPATAPVSGDDSTAADDFVLYSSQTYERGLSQRYSGGSDEDEAQRDGSVTQDVLTQTQFLPSQRSHPAAAVAELQQRLSQPAQAAQPSCRMANLPGGVGDELGEGELRRVSNASTCSARTTPGVREAELEPPCSAAAGLGPRLFPVFRSRKELKVLHIIRHGESEYNAATNGPKWEDPDIYDAPLTARGKQQATALRKQLAAMNLPMDVLWVTSPLTRAIQTLLYACPALYGSGQPPKIIVRSEITEKMATTGDVGHPASVLAQRFPRLADQLRELPEVWWPCDPAKPNCALSKKFGTRENKQQLQRRIGEFKRWLQSRPEKVIVAVGHSMFWREFARGQLGLGEAEYMRNCDLMTLHI